LNAAKATVTGDIRQGLTNQSRVDLPGSGLRVATTTAPDGSQSISTYQDGRLLAASRRAAAGASLACPPELQNIPFVLPDVRDR
jgi:hypothetical protein